MTCSASTYMRVAVAVSLVNFSGIKLAKYLEQIDTFCLFNELCWMCCCHESDKTRLWNIIIWMKKNWSYFFKFFKSYKIVLMHEFKILKKYALCSPLFFLYVYHFSLKSNLNWSNSGNFCYIPSGETRKIGCRNYTALTVKIKICKKFPLFL